MIVAPHITTEFAHFNALFLQPTPWCARNCYGCYVKGFEKIQDVTGADGMLFHSIIDSLGNKIKVNQVTLALDKLPSIDSRASLMQGIAVAFFNKKHRLFNTEFHATVHTVYDLWEYTFIKNGGYDRLDMISISHLDDRFTEEMAENVRHYVAPVINWNLTIDPTVNLGRVIDQFSRIVQLVDHVYLVLHKPNLGEHLDIEAFQEHQNFIKFIKTLPEDIQRKVTMDGCVTDSTRYLSTGYGCSSNVSRFQVWPDGSVTGCAYNQNKVTNKASTIPELLQNFVTAKQTYEFNKCKIPNQIDSEHPRIRLKHKNYLEIIE